MMESVIDEERAVGTSLYYFLYTGIGALVLHNVILFFKLVDIAQNGIYIGSSSWM